MLFRSGRLSRGLLPAAFFLILSFAFLFTAAQQSWGGFSYYYDQILWVLWTVCAPLSVLLIVQILRVTEIPRLAYFNLLLLVPIAYYFAFTYAKSFGGCLTLKSCEGLMEWLDVFGLIIGAISLLTIWVKRDLIDGVRLRKNGRERYWLIIALIAMNIILLLTALVSFNDIIDADIQKSIRVLMGIAFTYVASTSLFRIYPYAVYIKPRDKSDKNHLSDKDIGVAMGVEMLLYRDKAYQEQSYNRAKMAKELGVAESTLSKIVNLYFEKSVPLLLNELRVDEAKVLLQQTDVDIATLSEEVGFNSLASFNRVFKEITGFAPGRFRELAVKK